LVEHHGGAASEVRLAVERQRIPDRVRLVTVLLKPRPACADTVATLGGGGPAIGGKLPARRVGIMLTAY
jgi:hypothetical protein